MRAFVPARHALHAPQKDYSDGLPPFDHLEVPRRVDLVRAGLARALGDGGLVISEVDQVEGRPLEAVRALHDPDYVDFLLSVPATLSEGSEYVPPIFRGDLSRAPAPFRGGMYCQEVGTPIGPGSIEAALCSAATALAAADVVRAGDDAIALCRPPGHHAGRRRYGGYCFFNNAYLAAAEILGAAASCAVIDLDYHLGDGSLELSSARAPYFSLHADPFRNYPYLDAAAELEVPHATLMTFEPGVDRAGYLAQAQALLARAIGAHPERAIISLGFDTLGSDYIQDETTELVAADFEPLGELVAALPLPLLILLEGGYDADHLDACSERFFSGFVRARRRPAPAPAR